MALKDATIKLVATGETSSLGHSLEFGENEFDKTNNVLNIGIGDFTTEEPQNENTNL